jgi:hypothetical protein
MSTLKADTIVASDGSSPVTLTKQSAAKIWTVFDCVAAVTDDSFGQSSLSDDGVGLFTSSFTNNMGSASYTNGGSPASSSATTVTLSIIPNYQGVITTSSVQLSISYASGSSARYDYPYAPNVIHGDLA